MQCEVNWPQAADSGGRGLLVHSDTAPIERCPSVSPARALVGKHVSVSHRLERHPRPKHSRTFIKRRTVSVQNCQFRRFLALLSHKNG